jgi:hypothetical protein
MSIDTENQIELMFERDARVSELRIDLQRLPDHRRQASPSARTTAVSPLSAIQAPAQPSLHHISSAANPGLSAVRQRILGQAAHRREIAIPVSTEVLSDVLTVRDSQHVEAADGARAGGRCSSKKAEERNVIPLSAAAESRTEAASRRNPRRPVRGLRI